MFKKEDTYSYKGWLQSDYFLKRAFATWGHVLFAVLIFYGTLLIIGALFGLATIGITAL